MTWFVSANNISECVHLNQATKRQRQQKNCLKISQCFDYDSRCKSQYECNNNNNNDFIFRLIKIAYEFVTRIFYSLF
jgi:hypothetical protein